MAANKVKAEEIGIEQIFAAIWRRKLLIGLCIALSLAGAITLLAVINPRYTSSVLILLDPKSSDAVGTDGEFTSRPVDSVKIASVVSVIQSNELLDTVVKAQHLTDDPEFIAGPGLLTRIMRLLPHSAAAVQRDSEAARVAQAADALRLAMDVSRDGFTYVIKISVNSHDEQKAQRLTQAIADTYLAQQIDAKYGAASRDLKWLSERLKDLSGELMDSEAAVETVRRTYGLATNDGGASPIATQQITELNNQIALAQADLAQKRARAEIVENLRTSGGDVQSLPEVVASPVMAQLRARQQAAASRLAQLAQRFGSQYPDVIQAENERHVVDEQIAGETARIIGNIKDDFDTAVSREQSLQNQLTALKTQEGAGADGRSRLRQAQRVAQADRQLYDSLLGEYKTVEQKQTMQQAEARIISPALVPTAPSFPKPTLFLIGGLGVGVALGAALAFLLEQTDRTFATPAQIEHWLGVPVLASVPQIRSSDLGFGNIPQAVIDYTVNHPLSRYSESLRAIRTGLSDDHASRARIVQFTSPMPSEGKSTLAACVGVSSAMAGMRTIIIDCDFRNPSSSAVFQGLKKAGVAEFLKGASTIDEVLIPTQIPSLSIIPAGNHVGPPPDLVHSDRLLQLALAAIEKADFVIIDSAAMEAVADAARISQIADSTVMVVRWRLSDRAMVARSIARIRRAKGHLAGAVLNAIDLGEVSKYGYWSRANMRQMTKYFEHGEPRPLIRRPTRLLQRYSGAIAIGLATLASIFGAQSLS